MPFPTKIFGRSRSLNYPARRGRTTSSMCTLVGLGSTWIVATSSLLMSLWLIPPLTHRASVWTSMSLQFWSRVCGMGNFTPSRTSSSPLSWRIGKISSRRLGFLNPRPGRTSWLQRRSSTTHRKLLAFLCLAKGQAPQWMSTPLSS